MTRAEQNEAIAEVLGFKKGMSKTLVVGVHRVESPYWVYPKAWRSHKWVYPMRHLPDFVGMIEEMRRIQALGQPVDYGTQQKSRYLPL